ncbi:hypothetical protein BC827DRAFT_1269298 [Russula dissimulans]|nr:hypothetical protein BC827DRAFT_1269298 [Russula dissimulans]
MPSTRQSHIPLDTLPFLSTHSARNDIIFADQPTLGRHLHTGDEELEEDDGEGDGDEEHGHHHHHHHSVVPPTRGGTGTPTISPAWRLHLYNLLERPNSSPAAVLIHVLVTFLIVFSAIVTVLETVPAFHSFPGGIWFGLETSLVALFTVEYVARCAATSHSWSSLFGWIGSFFGIMDLLAILPYYIEIALQKDTTTLFRFSILRTFRLLRVFRPFRYNNTLLLFVLAYLYFFGLLTGIIRLSHHQRELSTIEVMFLSFRRSKDALLALGFFVLMVVIVFSTLLYFIERGTWDDTLEVFINSDGDPSQFASIPAAAWFVIVTISTVGYGEITPRSFFGRLITLPLLLFGLLLIALPSFVLGREFSVVWNEMANGPTPRTPYAQSGHAYAQSEQSPAILTRLRARAPSFDGYLHTPTTATGTATATTRERERDEAYHRQLSQSHEMLAAQVAELRVAMDAQSTLLRRMLERGAASDANES